MSEVEAKLKAVREILTKHHAGAIRLRGVDWFSWITCGGTSVVIMTSETGIADVFVTANEAWILTDTIEATRLIAEEVPAVFQVTSFPWQDDRAKDNFVLARTQGQKIISDRPRGDELAIPAELQILKMKMQPEEIERYRKLGQGAARAMSEAMSQARPEWSENDLAAAGAKALWSRGIEPTLILVAGEKRGAIY
ncbi:MAG: peptidase M24, partial [Proteobacteria bacterium]